MHNLNEDIIVPHSTTERALYISACTYKYSRLIYEELIHHFMCCGAVARSYQMCCVGLFPLVATGSPQLSASVCDNGVTCSGNSWKIFSIVDLVPHRCTHFTVLHAHVARLNEFSPKIGWKSSQVLVGLPLVGCPNNWFCVNEFNQKFVCVKCKIG